MGPSGFQTKGLEYCGVVAALLFFSLLALCLVLCSTFIVDEYPLGVYPALWFCLVEQPFLWNIPTGSVTVFQLDFSRTVVEVVLKFLVLCGGIM